MQARLPAQQHSTVAMTMPLVGMYLVMQALAVIDRGRRR